MASSFRIHGRRPRSSGSPRGDRPHYKKKFGQHHLRSGDLCAPLIRFLDLSSRDEAWDVVEIGPGGGVLTAELMDAGARVLALEVDLPWAFHLHRELVSDDSRAGSLNVAVMDAQCFPWDRLQRPALLTGNLPFNVGTRLVEQTVLAAARRPEWIPRLGYMLQKEVADRLTTSPGEKAYGGLTVLVRALCHSVPLGTLAPGAFRPPPKVSAAFVGLTPRPISETGDLVDEKIWPSFRKLVHGAFSQRRKTLRNSLGSSLGKETAVAVAEEAGVDLGVRAETLGLEEFLALFAAYRQHI